MGTMVLGGLVAWGSGGRWTWWQATVGLLLLATVLHAVFRVDTWSSRVLMY